MSLTRRTLLRTAAVCFGAAAICPGSLHAAAEPAPARKPNFVIVFTDDQGYQDLGCYGSPLIATPNIDRMAAEGMKFTDFYTASSVCSPSRAALLTGCYPMRLGFNFGALYPGIPQGLNPREITMADMLKTQGYTNACIGKWHLGGNNLSSGDKDLLVYHPLKRGFDYFYGFNSNGAWLRPLVRNYELVDKEVDTDRITGQLTAEAVTFIKENKSKPFLLYLAHWMPHLALGASERFKGKSKRGPYGDAMEEVDWSTGEVLKALKDAGIDDSTLVIFTSDNGPAKSKGEEGGSADPWVGGKFGSQEGGQRVPCVMRWPGTIPAATTCTEVATTMDFFVTFAGITGGKVPADRVIDGKDILPLMTAQQGAVSPYTECGFFYQNPTQKNVRKGTWKFGDNKLYDLTSPEHETRNLAKQHPEIAAELKALAEDKWKEIERNFRPIGDLDPANQALGLYDRPKKPKKAGEDNPGKP